MLIKKILIALPLLIFAVLLQSFFWVPTYDEQAKANPRRLEQFITASTGDARILNPILNADSASSAIVEEVFDGLIDRDEALKFRGRLARSWDIYEEAYFYINDSISVSGRRGRGPAEIRDILLRARDRYAGKDSPVSKSLGNIRSIQIMPARQEIRTVPMPESGMNKAPEAGHDSIKLTVHAPARIKLTLGNVDQSLFASLEQVLGPDYFRSFAADRYVVSADPETNVIPPGMAEKILPATEHNPVIIFHLREGVLFHDGHEFDAGDVRFTYEAIMNPKNLSPRTSDYEPVKFLETPDKYTVRITYKRLYSPAFSTWGIGMLPEHLLNSNALRKEALSLGEDPAKFSMRDSRFNRHPVGTGPFVFRQWESDQFITLDRNDHYWEGAPNYRTYTYRVVPDVLTQEMEFYGGAIDNYSVQPHQVERLARDSRYQNFSGLSFGYTYIGYNMRRELFRDRRVRRALGMAIDVGKIIKYVMYNQAERITGPFVKQTDYYDQSIRPLPYDPEAALKLLGEAGWKKNSEGGLEKDGRVFSFTLLANSGNDLRKSILAIAQDAWRKIGIDVRTDIVEWTVFIGKHVNTGNFDALILGWSMGIDPDLYQIWHSSQTGNNQLNFVGFQNKEADDLIIKIRQEYDHDKQVEYCHRLHRIIAEEQPYTFLYVGKWSAVLDKKIVIRDPLYSGDGSIRKITPTRTGSYTYYFNRWIKLAENPVFEME